MSHWILVVFLHVFVLFGYRIDKVMGGGRLRRSPSLIMNIYSNTNKSNDSLHLLGFGRLKTAQET